MMPTISEESSPSNIYADTQTMRGWGPDVEVASSSNERTPSYEEEHQLRIDLETRLQTTRNELLIAQNNLWDCEKRLGVVQKNEKKALGDLEKVQSNLARLERIEADMDFVFDTLGKVGIQFLSEQTGGVLERKFVCDEEKNSRWALVQQTFEHGCYELTKNQPLDATTAINTVLDAYNKQVVENRINLQQDMEIQEVGPSTASRLYSASHERHPPQINPYSDRPLHMVQWQGTEAGGPDTDYSTYAQGLFSSSFQIPEISSNVPFLGYPPPSYAMGLASHSPQAHLQFPAHTFMLDTPLMVQQDLYLPPVQQFTSHTDDSTSIHPSSPSSSSSPGSSKQRTLSQRAHSQRETSKKAVSVRPFKSQTEHPIYQQPPGFEPPSHTPQHDNTKNIMFSQRKNSQIEISEADGKYMKDIRTEPRTKIACDSCRGR